MTLGFFALISLNFHPVNYLTLTASNIPCIKSQRPRLFFTLFKVRTVIGSDNQYCIKLFLTESNTNIMDHPFTHNSPWVPLPGKETVSSSQFCSYNYSEKYFFHLTDICRKVCCTWAYRITWRNVRIQT